MYQNIFITKRDDEKIVYLWDDEKGMIQFPYPRYAYKKQAGGKYKSIYGDELVKVTNFPDGDHTLFESDVPADTRVLLDLYDDSDEPSKGHRIGVIDIEVSTEGGFPNIEEGDKEITAITLYDYTTKKYYVSVLDKKQRIRDEDKDDILIRAFDDEETMLTAFLNKWQELSFTIVTGWNINDNGTPNGGFDMPYLYNRIKRCLGAKTAKELSPLGIAYINSFRKHLVVAGIALMDYILLYKKFSGKMEPTYALGPIGKKVVNINKVQYEGSLDDLYKTDIQKFIEYNLNDVKIVVALDKKLRFIDLARRICHVGHVPYENFHMSSRYLDGAILLFLKRNGGLIAPNKPRGGDEEYQERLEEGEEGFSGAYVKEPKPGIYNWIFDLDLTSMYPNIIISLNISPETKVGKITKVELTPDDRRVKYLSVIRELRGEKLFGDSNEEEEITYADRKCNEFDMDYHSRNKLLSYNLGQVSYTNEDFRQLITDSKYSLSSNGVLYRTDKKGVIPEILSVWFQQRKDMRKKAKECRESGDNDGYFFNNQRQQVWKILLNSAYGVLGLPIFRFYDIDNAEAVTSTGVSIIKSTGKVINYYYKQKLGKKYKITYEDGSNEIAYENQTKLLENKVLVKDALTNPNTP